MTTKIVTTLIAGTLLAGSAAASLRSPDAVLSSVPLCDGCYSRSESTKSGVSPVAVVAPPAAQSPVSAGTFICHGRHRR
jgi:hypothetical protein